MTYMVSLPENPQSGVAFNGFILQMKDDNSGFIDSTQCEDYGYNDVAINRYNTSRTMCEPSMLSPPPPNEPWCNHGAGTVLCSAGGSFDSYASLRNSAAAPLPTAKCISCPEGYMATRYFGGDSEFSSFNVHAHKWETNDQSCPNTANKLECRPIWGDWFTAWGDNPLKAGSIPAATMANIVLQSTFQCAPWGANAVSAPKRHCLTAGMKFTRYNPVGGAVDGHKFWLVFCAYGKQVYCKTTVQSVDETKAVCSNKKTVTFVKAVKKAGYSYNYIDDYQGVNYLVEPTDLPLPDGHDLKLASEVNGGLCNPVIIST